jgi:hypothetical protein
MDRNPPAAPDTTPTLEADDFYFEGPNLVFTAAYHLKRGSCCGSGCRHCPYRVEDTGAAAACEDPPVAG